MYSRGTLIIACLVAAALAFAVGFLMHHGDQEPATENQVAISAVAEQTPETTPARSPRAHTIRLTAQGPVPTTLVVHAGDSVTLLNVADRGYWPAADPASPCAGLDARRALGAGEHYMLTFPERLTCIFGNRADPGAPGGTIIIQ